MRLFASLLLCVPLLAGAAPADQVVHIASADAEMNAAIKHAQDTLDSFLKIVAAPPKGASHFKLKVRFSDDNGIEHMWVRRFTQTGDKFVGELNDDPEVVRNVSNGQTLTFKRADISDWGYAQDGKQKGSFTVCVMFKHMPVEEAKRYRQAYGFEC